MPPTAEADRVKKVLRCIKLMVRWDDYSGSGKQLEVLS
jgi:hypothetical protein